MKIIIEKLIQVAKHYLYEIAEEDHEQRYYQGKLNGYDELLFIIGLKIDNFEQRIIEQIGSKNNELNRIGKQTSYFYYVTGLKKAYEEALCIMRIYGDPLNAIKNIENILEFPELKQVMEELPALFGWAKCKVQ